MKTKTFKIFAILFFIFIATMQICSQLLIYRTFVPVPVNDVSLMDQEFPMDTTNICHCILDDDY